MSRPPTNKRLIYHGFNEKIASGLTEADLDIHYLDLSDILPSNVVQIDIRIQRMTGTGFLNIYPNDGAITKTVASHQTMMVGIKNQKMKYALTVINDTHDIWLYGALRELSLIARDHK